MRRKFVLIIFIYISALMWSQDSYDTAVQAYWENDLSLAETKLRDALLEDPQNDETHVLLGILLQKKGQLSQAEEIMRQGIAISGPNQQQLKFNLANILMTLNRYDEAMDYYGDLIQGSWASKAYLNRAHCRLTLENYPGAVDDYQQYLRLDPQSYQKEQVEEIIALLRQFMDNEEEMARQAAQRARMEEEARLSAEREAAEEAARQQALLDNILNSLDKVGNDSEIISAGDESLIFDEEESDISD